MHFLGPTREHPCTALLLGFPAVLLSSCSFPVSKATAETVPQPRVPDVLEEVATACVGGAAGP